jgi:hypothetical protein
MLSAETAFGVTQARLEPTKEDCQRFPIFNKQTKKWQSSLDPLTMMS